jgi:agmatine deiminase
MTSIPKRLRIPAEWEPHHAIWTAWPSHADLWQDDLGYAREEVAAMIRALAPDDTIKVLACGGEAMVTASLELEGDAEIIAADFGDIWLRDTGPIFACANNACVALRFANNGWGGKYVLPGDDHVGDLVASAANRDIQRHAFILEGGALEHNGAGVVLTTRQCLLNPNRNPGWNEDIARAKLSEALQCTKILWLDDGLVNDHTDGHIDNLARFIAPDTVVCQSASGADDPNAALYATIAGNLEAMALTVHRIPSPGLVTDADGNAMPASHMNFIIGNATVVVPVYNTRHGRDAVEALKPLFPGRKVVGLSSRHLLTGGGSFHCITQQEPAGTL